MSNEDKIAALDWVHDNVLPRCATLECARNLIIRETIMLQKEMEVDEEGRGDGA